MNEIEPDGEESEPLRLDHFLKSAQISESGGQAKWIIQNGEVKLNGVVETRRRKKLSRGDVVEAFGKKYAVSDYLGPE